MNNTQKTKTLLSQPIVFATGRHGGFTCDDYCYVQDADSANYYNANDINEIYNDLQSLKKCPYFKKSAMNNTYFYKNRGHLITVDLETGRVQEFWI